MTSSNLSCEIYTSSNEPLRKKSRRGPSFRPNICTRTRHSEHFSSGLQTETLTSLMMDALTLLRKRDRFKIFHQPVDVNLVPDYLTIVEHPMDFSKIEFKIHNGDYMSFSDMSQDVDLIFSNCKRFNATNTIFFKQAVSIGLWWKKLKQQYHEKAYTLQHSSLQSVPSSTTNVTKPTPSNDCRDQTNANKPKPAQIKRRRLPYIKCKYKCIPPRDTPLSLGDILQYYGEKGVIQNFLQSDDVAKVFFFFMRQLVHPSKLKLLTTQNVSSSTISVLDNDKENCSIPQPEIYSSLIESITKFLGPSVSHILAPELPSLHNFFSLRKAPSENPPTKQERQEILPKLTPLAREETKNGSSISSEQLLTSYGDNITYNATTYGSVGVENGNSFTCEAGKAIQVVPTQYW